MLMPRSNFSILFELEVFLTMVAIIIIGTIFFIIWEKNKAKQFNDLDSEEKVHAKLAVDISNFELTTHRVNVIISIIVVVVLFFIVV